MPESATPQVDGDAAAAILLTLLGDQEAASILSSLNPDEAHRIGVAMMNVATATTADIEAALEMFVTRSKSMNSLGQNAAPRVRSVFTAALGPARAETLLTDIAPQQSLGVLEKLRWMKTEAISAVLQNEQPQVGALLLACLTPEIAAAALAPLSDDHQSDLIYRAASLGHVNQHALKDLEDLLDAYVPAETGGPAIKLGGRGDAAKIVTKMAKGTDQRVLKALKKRDKALAQDIEDDMFVFDDLSALDSKNMGTLMRSVDTAVLTLALRGASPETVDKMVGCLSVRAAQTIRDEMAEAAPAKRAEVEAAQKQIAGMARRMAEAGELNIGNSQANDDYV